MSEVTIRTYKKGDEIKINDAFNKIFNQNRSLEEWKWKFKPNTNNSLIVVAVDDEGEILSHYAATLVLMNMYGKVKLCGQNLDSFSLDRPDVLKRRLFMKTAFKFINDYGKSGMVPYFYGSNSGKILELGKLLFKYTEGVPITYIYKSTKRYQRAVGKFIGDFVWRWFIKQRPFKLAQIDSLWERASERYEVSVVKDAKYIQNRYLNHPSRQYIYITSKRKGEIEALAVLKYDVNKLHWVDLIWDGQNTNTLKSLEKQVWNLALLLGVTMVEMWLNNDDRAKEILISNNYQEIENPYGFFITSRSFDPEMDGELTTKSLYFTMGDTDMF